MPIRQYALALVFAGAFGFGATQALARPTAASFRACDPSACTIDCWTRGYEWGDCTNGSQEKELTEETEISVCKCTNNP